jgi:predicted RNA-binding protein with PIN domain
MHRDRRLKGISNIIIDGYNITGISHDVLARQRELLIKKLIDYRKIKGHDITVVFDGWKSGSRSEETSTTGGIKIIYSRLGEKADSVIKRVIDQSRREWIVISSDRDIMEHAWACGSVPVSSDTFLDIIENTTNTIGGSYELLEEDYDRVVRKGNPRKPSKKEKALNRVLKKL